MPKTRGVGPSSGLYAGLTLAEWRGSIRVIQSSGWWRFAGAGVHQEPAGSLHFAVVQAAALLLPLTWHKANASRFQRTWYAGRRGRVNARANHLAALRSRGAGALAER